VPHTKLLLLLSAGVLAFGLGLWFSAGLDGSSDPDRPASAEAQLRGGYVMNPPKAVADFTLIDQDGQAFHQDRWLGQWTFLYFGYTFCPDVCPLTLLELSKLQKRLEQEQLDQNVAYLLISVDPKRDTPQRLGEYTAYFNPKFRGATGTDAELAGLARQFGVYYKVPEPADTPNYTVDHSSTVTLIDPKGRLRAVFTQHEPEIMAADFKRILELSR
jgi:protein SCO1